MSDDITPQAAGWAPDTLAVRAGTWRSEFGEHSEAIFPTSSFVFASAASAAERFTGNAPGPVYSRFTNPGVSMLEERMAALEGVEAGVATASGMSAILATAMAHVRAGDQVLCARNVFGATVQLFQNILGRFGVETVFLDATDPAAWTRACTPATRMLFVETPSNPLTEISDITALADIARQAGALLVVDNCFATPILQQPARFGAQLIVHSATKFLDGQGRVLGGIVCGSREHIEPVRGFLRTAGPSLSPFNAWIIHKGLETLGLRIRAQSEAALHIARWLREQPGVEAVHHPWLPEHPQHGLARAQMAGGGAIVSFRLAGERAAAWRLIDRCRLFSRTANLGDVRSTITHPATTTHGRLSPEARAAAGIGEGLVRISVGLEAVQDLVADLAAGLEG